MPPLTTQQLHLTSRSPAHTRKLGRQLAGQLQAGDVICLVGDLGAGKTTFVQGLAQGIGARQAATSPSFVLVHEYQGRLRLFHLDLYRVSGDLTEIGVEELLGGDAASVVEWAERLPSRLCQDALIIEFQFDQTQGRVRELMLRAAGGRGRRLLASLAGEPDADSGP